MRLLDPRTALFCYCLCTVVCSAALGQQWLSHRKRYAGLGLWLIHSVLLFAGLCLVAMQGLLPASLVLVGGNVAIVGSCLFLVRGLRVFFGAPGGAALDVSALALFVALVLSFVFAWPSLMAREILFSLAMLFYVARGMLLLSSLDPASRRFGSFTWVVFAALILASLCRIALNVAQPSGGDLLSSPSLDTFVLAAYMVIFPALGFSLVLTVGRRALAEGEAVIAERAQAEAALRASEERFNKAFHASPTAIAITQLEDGRFVEVNESFCSLSGYSRERLLGDESIDVWRSRDERSAILEELGRSPFIKERELNFVGEGGRIVHVAYAGGLIELEGERHLLSIVRNLSERDRADALLRLRLSLREYSAAHSVDELMTKALEELEAMTGSAIGFYHFVDEERGILTRQAWAMRDLTGYCKDKGGAGHYPLDKAGVWADCIRRREPVVHNDYAALAGRRGMPEWHVPLKRELVAPTLREGKVVSILGVGNKASDYDEEDVALVSYIVDLVWSLVETKRSEEQILALNERLAILAMTDELTGIANRRSFFDLAGRELAKAARYGSPLAFIMIDIDRFKLVNDEWGHEAGDAALSMVAKAISVTVRGFDLCARLGGEEFGVLLPSTDLDSALLLAERLRSAVASASCELQGRTLRVTASFGVAARSAGEEGLDALMRAADAAMYRAKASGRDRVERA